MAVAIGGVVCEVYIGADGTEGGVSESWPREGTPSATVVYKCDWAGRYAVLNALRGGLGVGGLYARPHQYPDSPNLYCLGIGEVKGLRPKGPGFGGLPSYEFALIPALYEVPTWDPEDEVVRTIRVRTSVEVFQPPVGAYYWQGGADSGKPVGEEALGLVRPRTEIVVTRQFMSRIPIAEAQAYCGSVNANVVAVENYSFPRGTLLFISMNGGIQDSTLSGRAREVEYVCVGNGPVVTPASALVVPEWNQFMARDGSWQYVRTGVSSGAYPYRYTNFWDAMP